MKLHVAEYQNILTIICWGFSPSITFRARLSYRLV